MTDEARACYVYGVAAPGVDGLGDAAGVAGDEPVRTVVAAGVAAIVSDVPLEEFGPSAIGDRLEDPTWLAPRVRAHDRVLQRALNAEALVPFRFCTILPGEPEVRDFLARYREPLGTALARVAGKREWGIKAFLDDRMLVDHVRAATPEGEAADGGGAGGGTGTAYLLQKRRDRALLAAMDAARDAATRYCHERLAAAAAEATTSPPQPGDATGRDQPMVLNGAYLVAIAGEREFAGAADRLADEFADRGFTFERTGPWPAYHFADVTLGQEGR